MNGLFSKLIGACALFLFVILSGYWLAHSEKPYSQVIFTIHKLIALAAVIFFSILISRIHQLAPIQAAQWPAVAITALFLVALFATGGLLSVGKIMPGLVTKIHQTLPYLAVITIGIDFYLLVVKAGLVERG